MTRRKPYEFPEGPLSGRTGLAVLRAQPLHLGHAALISRMMQDCDTVILGFGSTQRSGEVRHPFSFEQRLDMARLIFGDRFRPVQLVDIDAAVSSREWADYVFSKLAKMNLPEPTDYYTGSPQDAKWYVWHFAGLDDPETRVGLMTTHGSAYTGKRLHILDRAASGLPPAEEIRSLIERRDEEWKLYVPARLVPFIEANYPPSLRFPLSADRPPEGAPVGTRIIDRDRHVRILCGDGVWRAEETAGS
jgi:hypothetical protein